MHGLAKDLDTGREQSITITAGSNLSETEIERAMRDAAEYAEADSTRMDAFEAINESKQLINDAQAKLKTEKKTIDKMRKNQINQDIYNLGRLI